VTGEWANQQTTKDSNVKWLNGGKDEANAELEFQRHLAISKRVKPISKYLKRKIKRKDNEISNVRSKL
jgi:hypothetical protein